MHFISKLQNLFSQGDINAKYCYYKYNNQVLDVKKFLPFKIIGGKVLTLPKNESLIYNADPVLRGTYFPLGGYESVYNTHFPPQNVDPLYTKIENGDFLIDRITKRWGHYSQFYTQTNKTSWSYTMKFKDFYNVNFR